jgi:2-dehydropantoate 2-reductase
MIRSDLKFLVVGAGAIGGITAALLKKNGIDVEIVCKYEEYAKLISGKGLDVSGVLGEFSVVIPAYASVSRISEQKDIILLATKANDMLEVSESIGKILKPDGYLIPMQNGICDDDLAPVVGRKRLIGCVTGWGATMESMGKLTMTSKGDFIIGYPERRCDDLLSEIAEILSLVVPARTTDNITGHKYSKLIINSCITSLGVICGLYLGNMLLKRKARNIFIEIIREAVEVAEKMNVKLEVFGGRLDFIKFSDGKNLFSDLHRHLFLLIIGYKYRKLKSSSLQSIERGKQSEIDFLNGYIVKNAGMYGVKVPVNIAIVNMIHQIERKERNITAENFNDHIFNRFD